MSTNPYFCTDPIQCAPQRMGGLLFPFLGGLLIGGLGGYVINKNGQTSPAYPGATYTYQNSYPYVNYAPYPTYQTGTYSYPYANGFYHY